MNSYLLCATQPTNLGDLIINKMLIDELCRYGKVFVDAYNITDDFKFYILKNKDVVDVDKIYGISLKKFNIIKIFLIIRRNKIKLYANSPGPIYVLPLKKRIVFRVIHMAVKLSGANVYNIGNCCSSVIFKEEKIKDIGIQQYFLRSIKSVDYINMQLNNRAIYIPDLAFLLRYYTVKKLKNNTIALNIRLINQVEDILKQKCVDIINKFTELGYKIELYYQVKGDFSFMTSLYQSINNPAVSMREEIVWFEDLDFYADKAFVVSNRLHSLLFGCVYGAIPIIYGCESSSCVKIKHVFDSSFGEEVKYFLCEGDISNNVTRLVKNREYYADIVNYKVNLNAQLCRNIIARTVSNEH